MELLDKLKHTLIVSCQAEPGYPLNTPERLGALAATVVMGGAGAGRCGAGGGGACLGSVFFDDWSLRSYSARLAWLRSTS